MPISGSSTLEIVGATTLGSTLAVSGTATLAGTTNAQALTATTLSGSSTLEIVGATVLGNTLAVSGNVTLGDAAADVTTVTGQLTASVGAQFTGAPIGIGLAATNNAGGRGPTNPQNLVTIYGSNTVARGGGLTIDSTGSQIGVAGQTNAGMLNFANEGTTYFIMGAGGGTDNIWSDLARGDMFYRQTADKRQMWGNRDGDGWDMVLSGSRLGIGSSMGTLTHTLQVEGTISGSSTLDIAGTTALNSNVTLGNDSANRHQVTGTLDISGSLAVKGNGWGGWAIYQTSSTGITLASPSATTGYTELEMVLPINSAVEEILVSITTNGTSSAGGGGYYTLFNVAHMLTDAGDVTDMWWYYQITEFGLQTGIGQQGRLDLQNPQGQPHVVLKPPADGTFFNGPWSHATKKIYLIASSSHNVTTPAVVNVLMTYKTYDDLANPL